MKTDVKMLTIGDISLIESYRYIELLPAEHIEISPVCVGKVIDNIVSDIEIRYYNIVSDIEIRYFIISENEQK